MSMNTGAYGELAFAAEATKHGLVVAFPFDDNLPFDMFVYDGEKISRIQIKTTLYYDVAYDRYQVKCLKRINDKRLPYEVGDADFLCAYVGDKTWYIVPFEAIAGKTRMNLYPHRESGGRFEMYKNAWNLITSKEE